MAREIDDELQFHVDALIEELTGRGASPEEARRIAARRFGRLDLVRDEARYAKGVGLIDDLRQDVRYGVRRLRRQPGFAVAVILTFGLGIGVNTAIFSLVDATLLKPLPFPHGDRLVELEQVFHKDTSEETHQSGFPRVLFDEWRAHVQIFDAIETYDPPRPEPLGDGQDPLQVARVSPGMFPLLGIVPALGRGFSREEAGSADVVLISDGLWKRRFGSDPHVLGQRLRLKDRTPVVIGVMPPGTRFPLRSPVIDAWMPEGIVGDPHDLRNAFVAAVARLRPGLTSQSCQPALERASAAIQQAHPSRYRWSAAVVPIDPRRTGRYSQPVVLVAFAAVGLVLVTACANIANPLLARTSSRQREMGVRRALGAGRLRIVRQLLVETSLLALGGGVVAVLLAAWLVRLIPALLPPSFVWFPVHEMQLDWRVVVFALGASVMVGLLSGVLPAMRGARDRAWTFLSAAAPMAARTRLHRRTRDLFIAAQVGCALVLLTGAGLMLASFARMVTSDPGYDTRNLHALSVRLPAQTYRGAAERDLFASRLLEQVRSIPGVVNATIGTPPSGGGAGNLVPEAAAGRPEGGRGLRILQAGPDYFRVLGIPIVAGREFSTDDRPDTTPVGVVDEEAARRTWPGQNPLGQRFRYSPFVPWITVVGIARQVKTTSVARGHDEFQAYLPESQVGQGLTLLVRTGDERSVLAAIRAGLHTLEPRASIPLARAVDEIYGQAFVNPRFTTLIASVFAALALLTAGVGVYAMLWYAVAQQTSEIGLRVALGAEPANVWRFVFADALRPVAAGLLVGVVMAWWLTRFITSQLYRVSPHDPATIGLAIVFVFLVAVIAACGPARRAARVDPIVALRCE